MYIILIFSSERYFSLLQTHKFPFGKYLMPTNNEFLIKFSKDHSNKYSNFFLIIFFYINFAF